ncbi:hypothetical protein [Prochlorococcus sp. MIT 1341]|uniref:hypothetical protein n=1 Tax=Prochlorococcus sp. MIT 1341 TaxID=3096221 RepID=UPI002A75EE4F|nr:hypothetical protein [Prochlorococcus sp. MIT 1341]
MSEKKAVVKTQLSKLRKELRDMHAAVTEEQIMPNPAEVKNAMTKMEELLELIEPKKNKSKSKAKKKT